MLITPAAAIADENLLGAGFRGDSWDRWRAVLKAAYAEPMTPTERDLFVEVAERSPPSKPVRELWVIAGRRGGKDSIASAVAATAALGDYRQYLRPGELASILCLAVDRVQAKIVLRYIRGYFTNPLLAPLVSRENPDGLELTSGIEIVVATNSFRAVRGRTILCGVLDEVAFWRSEESANPAEETYAAVVPGMVSLPTSMLIGISTAYRRGGLLFDKWRQHYGRDDDDVLVVKGATRTFNPSISQSFIDTQIERDPEAAAAEWLSEWRTDLSDFVDRGVVEAAVVPGRHELPYLATNRYSGFVDPSGGSADSMTLAVSHREGDRAVLDCIREIRPPFSPEAVVEEFAGTLAAYKITRVVGDRYAGEWPREQFRKRGIAYEPSDKAKNEIYVNILPLLNSGKLELLDNARMISQLVSLERRTARGGRDSIDHPLGGHDDVANAAAGALLLAGAKRDTLSVHPDVMQRARRTVLPGRMPFIGSMWR